MTNKMLGGANSPLPTNLGGTGAITPSAALTNLGAVAKAGDTMIGALILNADPALPLGAATKNYVDNTVAGAAPTNATYITQTPNATLTNEQALSSLATGILKSTTATGVVSIAAPGTDYYAPGGTDVALLDGGTGASLVASNGGIFYSTAGAGAILSGTATARQMLQSGASTPPAWSTATYPATTTINRILYSSAANVIDEIATVNSGVLVTSAGGVPSIATAIPNGVTATTQSALSANTTVATCAYVDSAVAGGGGGLAYVNQTTASVTMADNTRYGCNAGASLITFTLPVTPVVGKVYEIVGSSSGGWTLVYGAGISIRFGSVTTTATTGSLSSANRGDCVALTCITTTTFSVHSSVGNITYV